jgi:hypothetical protein
LGVGQILASITGWTNDSVEFKKELWFLKQSAE